uniref:L-lysine 6-monooxygenase [NADPH], aerobactin biosynthesis protein IucD n=1 Tax=Klebsiella pneumoniae TaxID=573 RepID=A0A8B0SZW2_KLEPN|nr:L-lysine 6-monooxygenase [NADPH], aerobactin biosynthesis protein IucD [Klebsiella pneumoniae]
MTAARIFARHPGMLVPDCHMQTMFLKDLVSAVAPHKPVQLC